ncbi:TPA_asm: hypothetical protein [Coelastrella green algae MELD virus]|nr:TPA_asm: hypothetical protein [Coelastrella green algae MELD virus]
MPFTPPAGTLDEAFELPTERWARPATHICVEAAAEGVEEHVRGVEESSLQESDAPSDAQMQAKAVRLHTAFRLCPELRERFLDSLIDSLNEAEVQETLLIWSKHYPQDVMIMKLWEYMLFRDPSVFAVDK